jgi:heterodisulfide reductase subunit A-like polyferredoxin
LVAPHAFRIDENSGLAVLLQELHEEAGKAELVAAARRAGRRDQDRERVSPAMEPGVVVVGAALAGITVAEALRAQGYCAPFS